MNNIIKNKLLFIETQDLAETVLALENYYKVFMSIIKLTDQNIFFIKQMYFYLKFRLAKMVEALYYYLWHVAKCQKELILV